jgi:endonuclease G
MNRVTLNAEGPSDIVKQDSLVPIKPGSKDTLSLGPSRVSEIMKHGYPSLDNIRIFENYVLSYDKRNRVPNWVFERLTPMSIRPGEDVDRGKSEFKEDLQLHPYFRSTNRDYKGKTNEYYSLAI